MKKILFFGTPSIAVPTLQKLAELEQYEVIGVGTPPDKPVGRKQVITPCPVKEAASSLHLPVHDIQTKEDLVKLVQNSDFDLAVVIAFGMIFPKEILEDEKFINIHFSLLPKYRGASPVQSAILSGEKISGITIQRMVEKLDAGDILWQEERCLGEMTTSATFDSFAERTAEIMPAFWDDYFSGKITPIPQDESQVSFCTKFKKADGEVFPVKETAEEMYRKYRAFDLFPGIFLNTDKGNIKLTKVSLTPEGLPLKCAHETTLFIQKAQVPGKKEMNISEILKGNPDLFSDYT